MYRQNAAFTLLEVILAMALSVLVIFALSMAVDLNLRLLDAGRTQVVEAQLARAVLQVIARDISAVVYSNPSDLKKLTSNAFLTASSQSGSTSQSGTNSSQSTNQSSQSGNAQNSSSSSTGSSSTSDTSTDETTTDIDRTSDLADATSQTQPGLYGNTAELLIDVSRLPRADQLNASNQEGNTANTGYLSDLKTVAYYVISDSASLPLTTGNGLNSARGLVRREFDRAPAVYAAQQGQVIQPEGNLVPLAPEVEAIEFHYFDGTQLLDTWDSISQNGLPVAVDITVYITRQHPRNSENAQPLKYHLLVNIPTAPPAQILP